MTCVQCPDASCFDRWMKSIVLYRNIHHDGCRGFFRPWGGSPQCPTASESPERKKSTRSMVPSNTWWKGRRRSIEKKPQSSRDDTPWPPVSLYPHNNDYKQKTLKSVFSSIKISDTASTNMVAHNRHSIISGTCSLIAIRVKNGTIICLERFGLWFRIRHHPSLMKDFRVSQQHHFHGYENCSFHFPLCICFPLHSKF